MAEFAGRYAANLICDYGAGAKSGQAALDCLMTARPSGTALVDRGKQPLYMVARYNHF
jgi:hypothetical protein